MGYVNIPQAHVQNVTTVLQWGYLSELNSTCGDDAKVYRGTFAVIDMRALRDNVRSIRQVVHPDTKMLVTVKADGYGHGMLQAAESALAGGADYLGVATLEEALALRTWSNEVPVLVLGATSPSAARVAAEHNIDVTVTDDWSQVFTLPEYVPPLRVHLKVDTGMTRLGFRSTSELVAAAQSFHSIPQIEVAGVFTHLACADAASLEHANKQMERFATAVEALHDAGLHPLVHAANSAAALRVPQWHYDMVRVGISAYGFPPGQTFDIPVKLRQAMNLYSHVTRVVEIEPGETVGYGATYTAAANRKIATVPIGYGDGYLRHLSNCGSVLVHGQTAPVVGNVCMDQLMIDVTEIDKNYPVNTGDFVTLYGQSAPPEWNFAKLESLNPEDQRKFLLESFADHREDPVPGISIDEVAALAGTISYEVVCALGKRVERLYFR